MGDWYVGEERNRRGHEWQVGASKERYFRELKENSFTVFVDNLPMSITKS